MTDRELPNNEDAETACLGATILYNENMEKLAKELAPHDFYSPLRRNIFSAMLELYADGRPIDPITIAETLRGMGVNKDTIPTRYVMDLVSGVPPTANIDEWVEDIRKTSVARDGIRMANSMIRDLWDEDYDAQEVIAKAEHKILGLNNKISGISTEKTDGFVHVRDIAPDIREQFIKYNQGISSGVPTGNVWMDEQLDGGGLQGKASYIIGGAEKSGKTSFALDWGFHQAVHEDLITPIVTLEMSRESLFKRLYTKFTGIPYFMFRPGFHDTHAEPFYTKALDSLDRFSMFPFRIADNLPMWSQIVRYCTRIMDDAARQGKKVGAIYLDYLQLITYDLKAMSGEIENTTMVSRAIKLLAIELGVPIVAMSNLNRVGMADGQEPDTYNLRGSQTIAFDAEAVLFVHDPGKKDRVRQQVEDRLIILSRQRNGPTGRQTMKYIGQYMTFLEQWQYDKLFGSQKGDDPIVHAETHVQKAAAIEASWDEDDDEWVNGGTQ